MLPHKKDQNQLGFYSTFEEQLNHQHPLHILANTIRWNIFDEAFSKHYKQNNGSTSKINTFDGVPINSKTDTQFKR